ncbi:leucine-rich repeat domain-containing protein [Porphyromonas gingivicanis]|nr:leucine-rich repeat domain-containing protein [Porphyromonas gingivicanis]
MKNIVKMKKETTFRGLFIVLMVLLSFGGMEAQNQITMTTSKAVGETLGLSIEANGDFTVEGATLDSGTDYTLTATDGRITIKGDVIELFCNNNTLTQLDVTQSPNLKELRCWNNQLSQLDVTHNKVLETLSCRGNLLTQLDVRQNSKLKNLDCSSNQLSQLDVSQNPNLTALFCNINQITKLDIKQNVGLSTLYCNDNQLSQLDVSINTQLYALDCSFNQLTQLDISKNTGLNTLECSSNQLTQLDVEKNKALVTLKCAGNQLAQLDISKNTRLKHLNCSANQLTQLDIDQNTELQSLKCSSNQLTQLDLSAHTDLQELDCSTNRLTQLNVSESKNLNALFCSQNAIRGSEMNALIASLPYRHSSLRQAFFGVVNFSNPDITEGNICTRKQVASIRSKNWIALELKKDDIVEYAGSKEIGSGVITMKTSKAVGESIDLALEVDADFEVEGVAEGDDGNYLLTDEGGRITIKGDVISLDCSQNQLTDIDFSKNSRLELLRCKQNLLKGAKMDALIASLPDRSSQGVKGEFRVVDFSDPDYPEGNVCTKKQVADALARGWIAKEWKEDLGSWVDYTGSEEVGSGVITMKSNKAVGSSIYLSVAEVNGAFEVEGATHKSDSEYTLTNTEGRITIKGDVVKFFCSENELTQIDVSQNAELVQLCCSENELTQLDVSKNIKLNELDCSQNRIKGEKMDALIASLPDRSNEEKKGKFEVIDFSDVRSPESNVCSKKQVATAKTRGWIAKEWNPNEKSWEDYEGSEDVSIDDVLAQEEATIVAIYSVEGRRLAELQEGVNIIRLSNGKTRKVLHRIK